jgi:hypothetical protein
MTRTLQICLIGLALAGCTDSTEESTQSIAQYCATTSLPCPKTWTEAQDPTAWGGCGQRNTNDSPILLGRCAHGDVAEMWGIDASTNYYYDAATGALIAITGHQSSGHRADVCVAGTCPVDACEDAAPRDVCP